MFVCAHAHASEQVCAGIEGEKSMKKGLEFDSPTSRCMKGLERH